MNNYIFLVTKSGYHTSICLGTSRVFYLKELIQYVEQSYNEHPFGKWGPYYTIRICIPNDTIYRLNELSVSQFEMIFKNDLDTIKFLLYYWKGAYPFFKKEVYVKYGILKE